MPTLLTVRAHKGATADTCSEAERKVRPSAIRRAQAHFNLATHEGIYFRMRGKPQGWF